MCPYYLFLLIVYNINYEKKWSISSVRMGGGGETLNVWLKSLMCYYKYVLYYGEEHVWKP